MPENFNITMKPQIFTNANFYDFEESTGILRSISTRETSSDLDISDMIMPVLKLTRQNANYYGASESTEELDIAW